MKSKTEQAWNSIPNLYFVIKPKSTDSIKNQYFVEVRTEIDAISNIEIITDLKKYNPYSMAFLADIIIGRYTSILEEAFAAGKKVIFYDNTKYCLLRSEKTPKLSFFGNRVWMG